CTLASAIHAFMQKGFLGRLVAINEYTLRGELRKTAGIETAKRGIGWRHQCRTVRQARTDITRRTKGKPPIEQGFADFADFVTEARLFRNDGCHGFCSSDLRKKSGAPKFPDLRASAIGRFASMESVHGTPGSISGPICRPLTPSAFTTAPDVSPPATTKREKPCPASRTATSERSLSTSVPAFSRPSWFCTVSTASGSSLE